MQCWCAGKCIRRHRDATNQRVYVIATSLSPLVTNENERGICVFAEAGEKAGPSLRSR
jgi:hypothetical protein